MSDTEGIDQNGGAIKEGIPCEHNTDTRECILPSEETKVESIQDPTYESTSTSNIKNTMDDTSLISDTDTSVTLEYPLEAESQSALSEMNENQEGKETVNKSTNEVCDSVAKIDQEEALNQSRELKSLLALSKEAKLDTNISRKRKVLYLRKKPGRKIQYPVTAESELEMDLHNSEGNKMETEEKESPSVASSTKSLKRKKSVLSEASGDSVSDDPHKKSRKSFSSEHSIFKPNKDMFCWRCHKDSVNISCETCPRSYHQKCLKQTITDLDHWPCPECVSILKAESTQSRSPAMKGMTLEHLCSLLKFAVTRMMQCQGSEPFIHAVSDNEFPEYKKYIIQPMDLTLLEKNIKENLYGSTQAFEADAKWILHNSIVFNSYQSKLTTAAKAIIKICKQEMAEIENCPSCYLNANTKKKTWFVEVCPKPHLLVWAKLRGFPFWPGKAMSCKDGMVDVRFFGAHDRAWVPEKECFLYSPKDPNLFRVKRADIEQCVEELEIHVKNLAKVYGEFNYPSFKTPLNPENEVKQLQIFLPRYRSYFNKYKSQKKQSMDKEKTDAKAAHGTEEPREEEPKETIVEEKALNKSGKKAGRRLEIGHAEDESMEGYGTDDESVPEIDTELRKHMLKSGSEDDSHEADEDDTQMPANIEPDTSGVEEVVLTKETVNQPSGENKLGLKKSESESPIKRPSMDDSSLYPLKSIRRNSDTKSESSRVSDKISKVNISEDMEISLANNDKGAMSCIENVSSSSSECSSDFSLEIKRKPVQVDVDNVEFTISPASKLKIADRLIKRLSDVESGEEGSSGQIEQVEQVKRNICSVSLVENDLLKENKFDYNSEPVSSTHNDVEPPDPKDVSAKGIDKEEDSDIINKNNETETNTKADALRKNDVSEDAQKLTENENACNLPTDPVREVFDSAGTKADGESLEIETDKSEKTSNSKDTIEDVGASTEEIAAKATKQKPVIRSEEKLDELMKKSMEGKDTFISDEIQEVAAKDNEDGEVSQKADVSVDEISSVEDSPSSSKTPLSEKAAQKIIIHSVKEKCDSEEHTSKSSKQIADSVQEAEKDSPKKDSDKNTGTKESPMEISDPAQRRASAKDSETDEPMDTVDLNIDKANIINIIHSSLIELDETAIETQDKVLKLVSIETIMNKANNNPDNNKENNENTSILKTSLQMKNVSKPASIQNSPSSSARNSVYEVSPDEIKSEPESEMEPTGIQDLEAKKKYLSALNILEKGEADAQKPKPNEIRTRSKTEEKRERFRVSNEPQIAENISKIIEDVALNYSAAHQAEEIRAEMKAPAKTTAKPDGGEIYVKSFAKIVPDSPEPNRTITPIPASKQRARKSFPQPNYTKPVNKPSPSPQLVSKELPRVATTMPVPGSVTEPIPRLTPRTPVATPCPMSTAVPTVTPTQTPKPSIPPLQQIEGIRPANGYLILQQPQQENVMFLPPNQAITYATSIANQVVPVTPCLVPGPTNTQVIRHLSQPSQTWHPNQNPTEKEPSLNVSESQNYIPQGEIRSNSTLTSNVRSIASSGNRRLLNGLPEPALVSSTIETSNNAPSAVPTTSDNTETPMDTTTSTIAVLECSQLEPAVISAENGDEDELSVLNSLIPEKVTRAVSEVIRRPPPKLKPRPPGVLSQQFNEGLPSSAGPVAARINSVAHRLGDYFRGMLIETLEDMGKSDNSEATIANLKLEIETLKHKHSIEISEIEKNMCTVLKDIQRSIIDDREKIMEETRAACEIEAIKRVEDAKSKQWCANCSKEAQFYCCWNTSYCDYPCQQKHWPNHMNKCTQNVNQPAQITPSSAIRPGGQQLILRPANPPPKGGIGRVFTKPLQKVYMNRNISSPKTMRVQTSAGNLLTMMETTPGNYQLVTSNALVRTGPTLTNIKPANVISVSSPGNTSINAIPHQKSGPSKQPLRLVGHSMPVTTVLEEESD